MTDPTPDIERLEERLEQVEERIEEAEAARAAADPRPEGQLWVESGTNEPDLDDQAIAPPG